MNRSPVIQYFDPKTGQLLQRRNPGAGIPMGPPPIRGRRRVPFGDIPMPGVGSAGPLISPYDEGDVWNPSSTNNGGSGGGAGTVNSSTAPTTDPSTTGYLPQSAPYGESDRPWTNPSTFATVPINAQTNTQVPVLSMNYQRNALIIQNGSTATVTGDVPPTLYVGFNAQPQVGSALALEPGVGIALDIICPRDSIYVAFGPFVNTGGSVVIQGAVVSSTFSP